MIKKFSEVKSSCI